MGDVVISRVGHNPVAALVDVTLTAIVSMAEDSLAFFGFDRMAPTVEPLF